MPALFDTHVHTSEISPCGQIAGREMAGLYKDAGYDGIVITDHFTSSMAARSGCSSWPDVIDHYLGGYRAAKDEGDRIGLTVLWGLEFTFDTGPRGDFLVYGASKDFLSAHPDITENGLADFRAQVNGSHIRIYQAHPFRPGHSLAPAELLDGIEVINANPRHEHDSARALASAERHSLDKLGGSDAHRPEDVGRAGIYLPEKPDTNEDFVSLLDAGQATVCDFSQTDHRRVVSTDLQSE